ncbi:hypothetical protein DSECCO2_600890 [anaerobic digester metagenome]
MRVRKLLGLLISWATPATSTPSDAILSAWIIFWLRSSALRSASLRAVMSVSLPSMKAVRPWSSFSLLALNSTQISLPSLRRMRVSKSLMTPSLRMTEKTLSRSSGSQ